MRRLILKRISSSPNVTLGVMLDARSGLPIVLTLENPWKCNTPYVSCIPKGVYKCNPYTSDKFKDVYEIIDVPGRSKILFHIGNTESNTKGCILPGLKYGVLKDSTAVLESATAMDILRNVICNNNFILEVT